MEVALPSNSADEPAIHRLVDDILAYIFLLNANPQPEWSRYLPIPKLKDPPTVEHATTVASSQVCTRWRSIALSCHTIWSLIIDYRRHSLKWIETLLDRSNPSPLDFGSRFSIVSLEAGGQGVLELVFNHIDRLRIFNLYVPASSWEFVCSRFLQMPAPNLEFMQVFNETAGHLTHPLFNNHAPNLRSLGLERCTIDLTSPVLTPLTELYVSLSEENAHPSLLDWLNILREMPSLRSIRLFRAISSGSPNDILPFIHLSALDLLYVNGPLHECVTLVKHLIVPPRCGLHLKCDNTHLGFDQRQLWAIIKKKIDSWAKNAPYRRLNVVAGSGFIDIGNLPREDDGWGSEEVDPIMSISLYLSTLEEAVPLFHSLFALFERTFFDTKCLHLWIDDEAEAFTPSFDSLRDFVNLDKLIVGNDSLLKILFPFLQHANSVLLPTIKTLHFYDVTFRDGSISIHRVADFLQWRREQGFPVQKIDIFGGMINKKYVLTHIQDTVVELDYSNSDTEEEDNI